MTEVKLNFNYIPLSFMSADEEIKRQIKNTVIMQYVLNKFKNPVKLVEQLVDTRYGYTDSSKEEGTHKFLRITDIKDGKVDWDSVPFCDCLNPTGYLLERGDILVARTGGTTGKSFLVSETESPSVFASYLIRLRTSKSLKPEFLDLYLNSFVYWNQITDLKQGSAQPNVNAEKLKGLIIPYCDIEMQENLLQLADSMYQNKDPHPQLIEIFENIKFIINKFEETEKLKVLFDNQKLHTLSLRQSILQEAIQGKLVPQDPNDEPASVLLEKIKVEKEQMVKDKKIKKEKPLPPITEDEIPYELPKGWEWVRLGDLITLRGGKRVPNGYQLLTTPTEHIYIRVTEMKNGSIDDSDLRYISTEIFNGIKDYIIEKDDLYITIAGTIGRIGQIPEKFHGSNLTENAARITPYLTNRLFLNDLLNSPGVQELFRASVNQMAQPKLALRRINETIVPFPPINEQQRIVERVNQLMTLCDELEKVVEQSKQRSELLMQAVLQEAFSKPVKTSNIVEFPTLISDEPEEDWDMVARAEGEIDLETRAKIKNRVTELLDKSKQ